MLRWLLWWVIRPAPTCECGEPLDDLGECHECEWEAPESGPRAKRSDELERMGVGR